MKIVKHSETLKQSETIWNLEHAERVESVARICTAELPAGALFSPLKKA